MGTMLYSMMTSLDGCTADAAGDFGWGAPDEELHRYCEELVRPVRTFLYGRRMYETMLFWETAHELPGAPPVIVEFARTWQAATKIVYSRTLERVSSERTRIEPVFDPAVVRELKAGDGDLTVDGPELAAAALRAGLVDEVAPIVFPVVVGGGTRFLPDGLRLDLALLDERRFASGAVHLRYRVRS